MSSHRHASVPSWSRQEFASFDLGDTRLNTRLVGIADAVAAQLSVIAWRLYYLTRLNRHLPEADCTQVVTEHEWRALYAVTHKTRTFPKKTPTVAQVILWIAKLGGFLGRKSDGPPA